MTPTYPDLKEKNVVVTGGATGLGYAIAAAFGAQGSHVLLVGRNEERLKSAVHRIGHRAAYVVFDLSDVGRASDLVQRVAALVGPVDVLVNNAGINLKKEALAVSDREFEEIVRVNQTAVFALSREIGKGMVERRSGGIIMISSMASRYGIPKVVAYTAAKSAIEGMTRALAVEWSPHGVRVNCIAPGFIATAMSARALDDDPERKGRVLARTPMGRLGEPSDVAGAALFLASEQARYITGVVLPVDGGNSVGF